MFEFAAAAVFVQLALCILIGLKTMDTSVDSIVSLIFYGHYPGWIVAGDIFVATMLDRSFHTFQFGQSVGAFYLVALFILRNILVLTFDRQFVVELKKLNLVQVIQLAGFVVLMAYGPQQPLLVLVPLIFFGLLIGLIYPSLNNYYDEDCFKEIFTKQYELFVKKYEPVVSEQALDSIARRSVLAILTFETYNRPRSIRLLERLLSPFGIVKTTGVMQVQSKQTQTDQESLATGIEWINTQRLKNKSVAQIAREYNGGEYALLVKKVDAALFD